MVDATQPSVRPTRGRTSPVANDVTGKLPSGVWHERKKTSTASPARWTGEVPPSGEARFMPTRMSLAAELMGELLRARGGGDKLAT